MTCNSNASPIGFLDPASWKLLCRSSPQIAFFLRRQSSETIEGSSTERSNVILRKAVLLAIIPDLLVADGMDSLLSSIRDEFGLPATGEMADLYDVCCQLHRCANLMSTIPILASDGKSFVHVGQLRLPPRGSFLAPSLPMVFQTVRRILARLPLEPLFGHFVQPALHINKSEENPDHITLSEDYPDTDEQNNSSFILSARSIVGGLAVQVIALAAAVGNCLSCSPDIISLLSQLPVVFDVNHKASAALLSQHFQNICMNSLRITDWSHYDFLAQYCELSDGDFHKGIDELNAKLKYTSCKINFSEIQLFERLLDTKQTPRAFRHYVNSFRQFLDNDADGLPFSKAILNHPMFFMGSSMQTTIGLVKDMYTHSEESFMLTSEIFAHKWLDDCNSHIPQDGNMWPKPPTVSLDDFLLHRHNVSFFFNLLQRCWKLAAGQLYSNAAWYHFKQEYASMYYAIQKTRAEFHQAATLVPADDDAAQFVFLLKLSQRHFPAFDEFIKGNHVANKAELQDCEHSDLTNTTTCAKTTTDCIQLLKQELNDARTLLNVYDELEVSKQAAMKARTLEYEREKRACMKHVMLCPFHPNDKEPERFNTLECRLQEHIAAFRTHISETTGMSGKDVYILININFSLRQLPNCKLLATKLGLGLRMCMQDQDAVLYRPVEWFSKSDDVDCLQRELHDSLFGMPDRTRLPSYHKTELSLSRTTMTQRHVRHTFNRVKALFVRKAKHTRKTTAYSHVDNWLQIHQQAKLWGSDDLWESNSLQHLPSNQHGVWHEQTEDYVTLSKASKRHCVGSSGVEFDAAIFMRLCEGPLSANKAVGIFDTGLMLGISS